MADFLRQAPFEGVPRTLDLLFSRNRLNVAVLHVVAAPRATIRFGSCQGSTSILAGRSPMRSLNRRKFLAGAGAAAAATATLATTRARAQKSGGTLRFVAQADLKILDPVWTTAYITRNHSYLVYDTLFGTDEKLQIQPQMVYKHSVSKAGMKYFFTLRDGLMWHDGQGVVAEDCVESLKRWGKKDRFGRLLMAHTSKITAVDRKTFTLELAERFGPVLDALGKPSSNTPFMMPARIAATSADEQIKEIVGSGPFRFVKDEWQPGNQVVYVRHDDYT